ncbi:MAG: hypothetical protein JXR76_02625 [Deltaproteobacteria bacterium]|nr:hypothetical protein [Deltaproteobacteria bacterium]
MENIDFSKFEYPFRRSTHSDSARQHMQEFTRQFIEGNQLFENVKAYVDVSVEFMSVCTPSQLTHEELEITCLFMLVYLILDDFRDHNTECLGDLGKEFHAVLLNRNHSPDRYHNFCTCLGQFIQRIEKQSERHCISATPFFERLSRTIDAFLWEDKTIRNGHPISEQTYMKYRIDLVGNMTSLQTNRIAAGLDHSRFTPAEQKQLFNLEVLSSKLVYLSNDLFSLPKDMATKHPMNLVSIISAERNWSQDKSLTHVQSLHDRTVDEFAEVKTSLSYATGELDKCIEAIELDVTGNITAMYALKKRY